MCECVHACESGHGECVQARESGPGERVCTRVHVCEAGDGRLEAAVWPQVQPVRRPRL